MLDEDQQTDYNLSRDSDYDNFIFPIPYKLA